MGALLLGALIISGFLGAILPVDLEAVCFVQVMYREFVTYPPAPSAGAWKLEAVMVVPQKLQMFNYVVL